MIHPNKKDDIIERVRESLDRGPALRKYAMSLLDELECYDWSGIYRLEDGELVLDEFVGAPTDHQRIAVGVGVCGTAVAEDRNVVVKDVKECENYLACSLDTRSEIVVLIRRGAEVLGQIDIDSHQAGAFDESDEKMLEEIAAILADRWN